MISRAAWALSCLCFLFSAGFLGQVAAQSNATVPVAATYDPSKVDWTSVVAACRQAVRWEKRFANFWIRAAFHDGLAVNPTLCSSTGTNQGCFQENGLDASLYLTPEAQRPENTYDNFTALSAVLTIRIATVFNTSIADALAVCASVSVEEAAKTSVLSSGRVLVGRVDSNITAPQVLPAPVIGTEGFYKFFTERGFSVQEAVALMGSHSLIDDQACYQGDFKFCDPGVKPCKDVRMFNLDTFYYHEICTPTIKVNVHDPLRNDFPETPIRFMGGEEFESLERSEVCKWTSDEMRNFTRNVLAKQRRGDLPVVEEAVLPLEVTWLSGACTHLPPYINTSISCPRFQPMFPYTVNDGFLGLACQGRIENPDNSTNKAIRDSMHAIMRGDVNFKQMFVQAFLKMINPPPRPGVVTSVTGVTDAYEQFNTTAATSRVAVRAINGTECPSGINATTRLCSTIRDLGNFGLVLDQSAPSAPAAELEPSPNNKAAQWVFGERLRAILIRRLDNAAPLSLSQVQIFVDDNVPAALPPSAASSSGTTGGTTAAAILDSSATTFAETDPSMLSQWFLIRLPSASRLNITKIVVTKRAGSQSSLVGSVVEVMNNRGGVSQLITTTGNSFTILVNRTQLVVEPAPAPGTSTTTVLLARFDGAPLPTVTTELFSRQFKVALPANATSQCPTAPAAGTSSTRKLAQAAPVSCTKVAAPLSALTRVDRFVLRPTPATASLAGLRVYFGQPEMAYAATIPSDTPAGPVTVFVEEGLSVQPGEVAEEEVFVPKELVLRRPAADIPLGFTAAQVLLFGANRAPITGFTSTSGNGWIRINLAKLPALAWITLPATITSPLLGLAIDVVTTEGMLSSIVTQAQGAVTTYVSQQGIATYAGTALNTVSPDTRSTVVVARYDSRPLTLSEIRLYDDHDVQIQLGLTVISSGTTTTDNPDNVLDASPRTATASGTPAWFAIAAPVGLEVARVGLTAGPNVTTWPALVGAHVYVRAAEGTVGGTVVTPEVGSPVINYDVMVGAALLVSNQGDDTIIPNRTGPSAINPNWPNKMSDPPANPFLRNNINCNVPGQYEVDGFPSSFTAWKPFTRPFVNPPALQPFARTCRADRHCMSHYQMDVFEVGADLGCGQTTRFQAYGGMVPGPTLLAAQGEEVSVRFNNRLDGAMFGGSHAPCLNGRSGRPISIHNHGSASTAPHDGWAESELCNGESKDYFYPNNRPGTGWYHDHGLDITAQNAYSGLAGFYIVTNEKGEASNCGQPWNLDGIPEYSLLIADKMLDSSCQLVLDLAGVHEDNFYGDLNLVSGIPWPVLTVYPAFVRFRVLIGGPTRPFKLRLVDDVGNDIGAGRVAGADRTRCQIVAGDGGFKQRPSNMPPDGLFAAVAERWELVCDLSDQGSKTLYLWNDKDDKRGKDVPFFCFSHLLMKINVLGSCPIRCPAPATNRLFEEHTAGGTNYRCGGRCYRDQKCDMPDAQHACCGEGQYCWRNDQWNHYCRSMSQPAPTCELYGAPRPDGQGNLICGGKCFTPNCQAQNKQHACCPAGQFCWNNDEWNHYCRPNPARGPTEAEPKVASCAQPAPNYAAPNAFTTVLDRVLGDADYQRALAMANDGKFDRELKFGRRGGAWVINGETWQTFRIAARDVGQNTYEVWKLETGGGWFHPIHIHLVDFWVIRREGFVRQVEEYEEKAPKDVVALHPSAKIWILARFGPHRGEYMFHCHNLVHEDRAMMRSFVVQTTAGSRTEATAKGAVDFTLLHGPTDIVYDLFNYKDPLAEPPTPNPAPLTPQKLQEFVDRNIYRIFYPWAGRDPAILFDRTRNPWRVERFLDSDVCPADASMAFFDEFYPAKNAIRDDSAAPTVRNHVLANAGVTAMTAGSGGAAEAQAAAAAAKEVVV